MYSNLNLFAFVLACFPPFLFETKRQSLHKRTTANITNSLPEHGYHGKEGSGASRANPNIDELEWKYH